MSSRSKRTWLILGGLLLVGLAVLLAFPYPRLVLVGLVRFESFVAGMPSSYWNERFQDPNPGLRVAAARALGKHGRTGGEPPEALIEAIKDHDADVRIVSAEALGRYGPNAGAAVPALIDALDDPHFCVRREAKESLGRIGSPAIPALLQALKSEPARVRSAAALALSFTGEKGRGRKMAEEELAKVVPALERAQQDPEPDVRSAAAGSLSSLRLAK